MSSLKQIDANRRNAQFSTGPHTTAGRAAVRFNALKSGINALSLIIAGEDSDELQALADSLNESCHPADAREQVLVDRMIAHEWRRRRIVNAEPIVWEKCFIPLRNSPNFNHETQTGDALHDNQQTFTRVQRLIASVEKSYHQAAADLDRLQAARAKIGFVPSNCPGEHSELQNPNLQPQPLAPASEASYKTPTPSPQPLTPASEASPQAGKPVEDREVTLHST